MDLRIYEPEKQEGPEPVRLALFELGGDVILEVVGGNGARVPAGRLLKFRPDGQIIALPDVDPEFGFDLDANGRLAFTPG